MVPFLGAFDKGTGKGTKPVPFLGAFVVLVPFFWCLSQNLVQCNGYAQSSCRVGPAMEYARAYEF